ncbi:MAG TPA: hypothetical protein VK857_01475 [Desulforhopalus sp.]|nr:hypothetical protein [Desulforhopalus sp.]
MFRYLHLARTLDKQLQLLRRSGKKAELAVCRYDQLVKDLRGFGVRHDAVFSKRTKNGENRLKNCVKYDLGGGYRLVTVRSADHLMLTFVGGHDEANQWIERHRYDSFEPQDALYAVEEIEGSWGEEPGFGGEENIEQEDPYEAELNARLDQSTLQKVFQGLYAVRRDATGSVGTGGAAARQSL